MAMIYAYAVKVTELFDLYDNDRDIFAQRMSLLCPERKKRVEEMKQPKDKARALGAGLLLQSILYDYLSLSVGKKDCGRRDEDGMSDITSFDGELLEKAGAMRSLQIECGEKGKPYLPEYPGIYFNLSHSGDYVAAVLSGHPVGIDIQEKKELSGGVLNRFFSESERSGKYAPFEIFSAKESYIKFTGEGMSRSLTDFRVDLRSKTIRKNTASGKNEGKDSLRNNAKDSFRNAGTDSQGNAMNASSGKAGSGDGFPGTEEDDILAYVRYRELDDGAYIVCVCDKCKDIIRWV